MTLVNTLQHMLLSTNRWFPGLNFLITAFILNLVFLGGLICAISSFPGIGKHISRSSISASYLHNLSGVSEEKRVHSRCAVTDTNAQRCEIPLFSPGSFIS